MNKLKIDLEYLIFAWQDDGEDSAYYLDTETGSVLLVQRDLDDLDELRNEIELQPSRYLYVPKPHPDQLQLDLSDFIFTVSDEKLRAVLSMAYESPNKVGACKTILSKYEGQLLRWDTFRRDAVRERVRRWLAANALAAES